MSYADLARGLEPDAWSDLVSVVACLVCPNRVGLRTG